MATEPEPEPRIPPIAPREWSPKMKTATAPLTPTTPRPPGLPRGLNILGTFANHPDLATAFWVFNGHILNQTTLTQRQLELAVLRVARLRNSEYEWRQHLVAARACGITEEEIEAVRTGEAHPWPDGDGALVRAVDELIADAAITDDTWTELSAHLNTQEILDFIFTVGAYEVIAMMLSVAGTPLDDDLR